MKDKYIAAIILGMLTCLLIWYHHRTTAARGESFDNREDKIGRIFRWFTDNPVANYVKYQGDFGRDASIVDYDAVLNLAQNKNLTEDNVRAVL